jgi:hypothetical protein
LAFHCGLDAALHGEFSFAKEDGRLKISEKDAPVLVFNPRDSDTMFVSAAAHNPSRWHNDGEVFSGSRGVRSRDGAIRPDMQDTARHGIHHTASEGLRVLRGQHHVFLRVGQLRHDASAACCGQRARQV